VTDGFDIQDTTQTPPEAGAQPVVSDTPVQPDSGGSFFASKTGRILMIAGAAALLLAIVVVVAVIALGAFSPASTGPTIEVAATTPGSKTGVAGSTASSGSAAASQAPSAATIDDEDVFVPRDPFKTVTPPTIDVSGTISTSLGTILVVDIVGEDGVYKAVLEVGGKRYTVGTGERVGSTPWLVVAISRTTVILLYGDNRVELESGQGVSK
jgi:hypothetical protein